MSQLSLGPFPSRAGPNSPVGAGCFQGPAAPRTSRILSARMLTAVRMDDRIHRPGAQAQDITGHRHICILFPKEADAQDREYVTHESEKPSVCTNQ